MGFIAGIPKAIDYDEIVKIMDLGVIGFKIYPLSSMNEVDWTDYLIGGKSYICAKKGSSNTDIELEIQTISFNSIEFNHNINA